jgi:hypothetical protein
MYRRLLAALLAASLCAGCIDSPTKQTGANSDRAARESPTTSGTAWHPPTNTPKSFKSTPGPNEPDVGPPPREIPNPDKN